MMSAVTRNGECRDEMGEGDDNNDDKNGALSF